MLGIPVTWRKLTGPGLLRSSDVLLAHTTAGQTGLDQRPRPGCHSALGHNHCLHAWGRPSAAPFGSSHPCIQIRHSTQGHATGHTAPAPSVRGDKEYERAKNSAIGSLSLRPHSRVQLENKLEHKGYSKSAIAKALDRLAELELQSDADYAEVYTRSKWRQAKWAPSRIQQELKRHGVNSKDCTSALESVFGVSSRGRIRVNLDHVEDEPNEEESVCGTEERVDYQLLGSARRQAELTAALPIETRRRRLTGWLQRRGHDWETIAKVLAVIQLK